MWARAALAASVFLGLISGEAAAYPASQPQTILRNDAPLWIDDKIVRTLQFTQRIGESRLAVLAVDRQLIVDTPDHDWRNEFPGIARFRHAELFNVRFAERNADALTSYLIREDCRPAFVWLLLYTNAEFFLFVQNVQATPQDESKKPDVYSWDITNVFQARRNGDSQSLIVENQRATYADFEGFHPWTLSFDQRLICHFGSFLGIFGGILSGASRLPRDLIRANQKSNLEDGDQYQQRRKYGQSEGIARNLSVRGDLSASYWRVLFGTLLLGILFIAGCCFFYWMMGWK